MFELREADFGASGDCDGEKVHPLRLSETELKHRTLARPQVTPQDALHLRGCEPGYLDSSTESSPILDLLGK